MRATTSGLDTAKAKTGTRPAYLLELGASPVRLSTRAINDGTHAYTAGVISFGPIACGNDRLSGGETYNRAAIRLVYDAAVMDECLPGAPVSIYLWFDGEGLASADRLLLFSGVIVEGMRQTREAIEIVAEGLGRSKGGNIGSPLDTTEWPDADPEAIGHIKPILFGTVAGAVCAAVDSGAVTTLPADITSAVTSIALTSAARFPASGTVQIGDEKIAYTGKSGSTLTGCTRGSSGTTAAAHSAGAIVVEVQTLYRYMIADHAIKSVSAVYVDGVLQASEGSSTLSSGITDVSTSLTVASATNWPNAGRVLIDSEQINYTSRSGNVLTVASTPNGRGANGTTAASHSGGATVTVYDHMIEINNTDQAFVVFSTAPVLERSATIETTDTINASSTTDTGKGVTDATTTSVPFSFQSDASNKILSFNSRSGVQSAVFTCAITSASLVSGTWNSTEGWLLQARARNGSGTYLGTWQTVAMYHCEGCSGLAGQGPQFVGGSGTANFDGDVQSVGLQWATYTGSPPTIKVYVSGATLQRTINGTVTTTKTGTVTVTGGSAAEVVIGSQVAVDCVGFDTHRPDEIIEKALLTYGDGVSGGDLDATVTDSSAVYSTNYNMRAWFPAIADLMKFCKEIAYQSASRFFWDNGKAYLKKIPTTAASVDAALTTADLMLGTPTRGVTPYDEIINLITARYDDRQNTDQLFGSIVAESAGSQALYGVNDISERFNLTRVSSGTTATNTTSDYLTRYAYPKHTATVRVGLKWSHLQRGDVVTIDHAAAGFDVLIKWEIMATHHAPGGSSRPDSIELVLEAITETMN